MKGLRIVFMGTPEFAVSTLEKIHHSRHEIVGVVTQPDRPRGRGKKLLPTPVKQFALDHHLSPVLQPEKIKDPAFVEVLRNLSADVFVVVAFRILPEAVFTLPPRGTINLHPSLLPKYRGAAPINWTIINGETETGITTMFIQKEIDAGNIIFQRKMPVFPDDTAGTLHDRLAAAGADLILETLDALAAGQVAVTAQDHTLATPAPKITKEMCHLNFAQPATQVRQWIHGLSPYPGAFAFYEGQMLKLFRAAVIPEVSGHATPGTLLKCEGDQLWIACAPGAVNIRELQAAGKKRLPTADFLRGASLKPGRILT